MNLRTSGPWHYLADESEYFLHHAHGFSTELGTPSVPTAESMRKFIPETDRWPISDTWHYHELHFGPAGILRSCRYALWQSPIARRFLP